MSGYCNSNHFVQTPHFISNTQGLIYVAKASSASAAIPNDTESSGADSNENNKSLLSTIQQSIAGSPLILLRASKSNPEMMKKLQNDYYDNICKNVICGLSENGYSLNSQAFHDNFPLYAGDHSKIFDDSLRLSSYLDQYTSQFAAQLMRFESDMLLFPNFSVCISVMRFQSFYWLWSSVLIKPSVIQSKWNPIIASDYKITTLYNPTENGLDAIDRHCHITSTMIIRHVEKAIADIKDIYNEVYSSISKEENTFI